MASAKTKSVPTPVARYCAYCANGHHRLCTSIGLKGLTCECADRAHDPEVRVAAAMRLYQAPDLYGADIPHEQLATQWRTLTGRL